MSRCRNDLPGFMLGPGTYKWGVNKGKIITEEGSPSMTVDLTGTDRKGITATVEVGGLAEGCDKSFSCTPSFH
jgi:hypothetical protein